MGFKAVEGLRHWITSRQFPTLFSRFNRIWVLSAATLAMMTAAVLVSAKPVTLMVHGRAVTAYTFARTVGDLLVDRNIRPGPHDLVTPAADCPVSRGEVVRVSATVPVQIRVDGEILDRWTAKETVAGVLKENGIEVGPKDRVVPGMATQVTAGMAIRLYRMTYGTEVTDVPLPFSTRQVSSPDLYRGMDRITQTGTQGLEKQVWQVAYLGGKPVSRTLVKREILRAPRDRVVQVGSLDEVSRGGSLVRFERAIEVRATAYTGGGYTATGTVPRVGTVAVDPRVIPLGSRLYVQGYGYGNALDTGGLIKGDRIDLYFPTSREVDDWGVRYVRVFVLD